MSDLEQGVGIRHFLPLKSSLFTPKKPPGFEKIEKPIFYLTLSLKAIIIKKSGLRAKPRFVKKTVF